MDEDEDDFAKMLGESLAEDADADADGMGEEDDDEEEEEDDDEEEEYDDALEGARFAPRQVMNKSSAGELERALRRRRNRDRAKPQSSTTTLKNGSDA